MGQLNFPPHIKADRCASCPAEFVARPAPCCAEGQMHVVSVFEHGKTGEKMRLLECSDCGKRMDEKLA